MTSHALASTSPADLHAQVLKLGPAILERGSPDFPDDEGCEAPDGLTCLTPDLGEFSARIRLFINPTEREQMRRREGWSGEFVDVPTGLRFSVEAADCGAGCRCAARVTRVESADPAAPAAA